MFEYACNSTSLNQVNLSSIINAVHLQHITVHIFCNASEFGTKTFSKAHRNIERDTPTTSLIL